MNLTQLDSGAVGFFLKIFSETLAQSEYIPEGLCRLLHCQGLSLCLGSGILSDVKLRPKSCSVHLVQLVNRVVGWGLGEGRAQGWEESPTVQMGNSDSGGLGKGGRSPGILKFGTQEWG